MEGHDSLLLGWYPTPTTPAYPSVDLPPGPQAPSTSNLVRLPPGDYPDLRTPIIQQHEPGETTAAGTTSNGANTTAQTAGPTSGTATAGGGAGPATIHLPAAAAPAAATGGGGPGGEAAIVVNVAGRMGSASSQQNAQQQQHTLHLSGHHIVTPSVAQLHVTQAGTAATMVSGTSSQLGGQTTGTGAQVLQQVVAQAAGGGHQLVHMVLHHPAGTGQTNSATAAVSMGGTLQIGGLASVGSGVTVQALTAGMPSGGLGGGGIVNVGTLGVLEGEEAVGVEGGPPFRCEECGHVAKTKRMLKRHLATVHSQERNYPCPYCDAKFKLSGHLNEHLAGKHNIGKCTCDQCGKLFSTPFRLKQHTMLAHQDFRFACGYDGCDYKSKYQQQLNKHVRLKHLGMDLAAASGRRKCTMCDFEGYCLAAHVRAVHTKEKPYKCQHCDRTFSDRNNQRAHEHRVHSKDRLRHKCSFCEQMFYTPGRLREHIAVRHTHEHTHLCENCGFSTAVERTYLRHRKSNCNFHEMPLKCPRCDFTTHIPFLFKTHKAACEPDADEGESGECRLTNKERKQRLRGGARLRKVKLKVEEQDMPWENEFRSPEKSSVIKPVSVRIALPAKKRGTKGVLVKDQRMHWTSSEDENEEDKIVQTEPNLDVRQIGKKPRPETKLGNGQRQTRANSDSTMEQKTKIELNQQMSEKVNSPKKQHRQSKVVKKLEETLFRTARKHSKDAVQSRTSFLPKRRSARIKPPKTDKTSHAVDSDSDYTPRNQAQISKFPIKRRQQTIRRMAKCERLDELPADCFTENCPSSKPGNAACTEVAPVNANRPSASQKDTERLKDNKDKIFAHNDDDDCYNKGTVEESPQIYFEIKAEQGCLSEQPDITCRSYSGDTNSTANGEQNVEEDEVTIETNNEDANKPEADEVEMFACPQCDTFFVSQVKFTSHIVETHVNKVKIRVGSKEWKKAYK